MPAFKDSMTAFHDSYIPEPNSGCWIWSKCLSSTGYAVLQSGGFRGYAHRFSYQHLKSKGEDMGKFHVCHKCDVPSCVNPDHLFLGTASDNMRDCMSKGRHASQRPATNYAKGEDIKISKLNPDSVKMIRFLKGAFGQAKIAKAFGVTRNSVREIHSRRTWSHV